MVTSRDQKVFQKMREIRELDENAIYLGSAFGIQQSTTSFRSSWINCVYVLKSLFWF